MANQMQYWDNGFPINGVDDGTVVSGQMQYWDNGFPFTTIFPPIAGSASLIKAFNGVEIVNIKEFRGVPLASVKTVNGLSNI